MHVPGVTGLQRARAALPASRAVARPACNPARPRGMGGCSLSLCGRGPALGA